MNNTKTIWQSLTIKFLVALAAITLTKAGYDVTSADKANLFDMISAALSFVAIAGAWWGRIKATKKIVSKDQK